MWALLVLPDGSLVSGDSAGLVAVWDGGLGTQLSAFSHDADILALAASPAGDAVFASGVDPRICLYRRVPGWCAAGGGEGC